MSEQKTPWHLWVIGIVSLLWNAVGAFDYTATQLQLEAYMSQFTQEQLDYFYGFPAWMVAFWATAVWSALLGSLCLLLRTRWAVGFFALAIVGLLVSSIYNFALTDGAAVMGQAGVIFTGVIWLVSVALLIYARSMSAKGILR